VIAARRRDGRTTANQLLDVAEQLFAERGIEAVSLREIGRIAQSRNTSVANYHFKDKTGLVHAVLDRRFSVIDQRRRILLDEAIASAANGQPELDALVVVLYGPLIEQLDTDGYYIGFVDKLTQDLHSDSWNALVDAPSASWRATSELLVTQMAPLDRAQAERRLDLARRLVLDAVAMRQAQERADIAPTFRYVFVSQLLDATYALLTGPVREWPVF
jgi:AcrR family transcriptional regulator